jgi:hypothetical protein
MPVQTNQSPKLYFTRGEDNKFHLSAKRYEADSMEWENNNIELKAVWFSSQDAIFNVLSNVLQQAGVVLLRDC